VEIDPAVVAAGRASVAACGLALVGEPHGVAQTPSVVLSLARRLGTRGLALEWSHDELDPLVQPFVAGSQLDLSPIWRLPPDADALAGDGRVTAGHFALLEALRQERRLERLTLVDRSAIAGAPREGLMAERLRAALMDGVPTLAVVGGFHALLAPGAHHEPMGALLAANMPGLASIQLAYAGGARWFHGVRPLEPTTVETPLGLALGPARPAVVPLRRYM
jgi:hypothetical protein